MVLAILFLTRRLAEIVIHAQVYSQRFASVESVEFRCEWSGLLERELRDPDPTIHWPRGRIARVDHRVTVGQWPVRVLANNWPEIESALGGPVIRLFHPTFDYSADFIRQQLPRLQVRGSGWRGPFALAIMLTPRTAACGALAISAKPLGVRLFQLLNQLLGT
jgi:hypothetical protein